MPVNGLHPVALVAILAVLVLLVAGLWLAFQPLAQASAPAQVMTGTWMYSTGSNATPAGLVTFHADGTLIQTGGIPLQERSAGHGDWVRAGDWCFAATIWVLQYDEAGEIRGRTELYQEIQVEPSSETAVISQRARTWDAAGRMIGETPAVIQEAQRIRAEPPRAQPIEERLTAAGADGSGAGIRA
jgi:hypothetical protein